MPEVIRRGLVEVDEWRFVDPPAAVDASGKSASPIAVEVPQLPADRIVLSLAAWRQWRERLIARQAVAGVWLGPADDPAAIAQDLARLKLVAIHFPRFADGRGYSSAFLLRTRHGYRGELRAFGDVGRDQLFYLKRCGFDSFALPPHRDPRAALAGLDAFSLRYQGSVDDPLPLFRKRFAAPHG